MQALKPDKARTLDIYNNALALARETLESARKERFLDLTQVLFWIDQVIDALILKDTELLSLFYENTPDNYLPGHMVNVTIMCLQLGLGLGYNKSRLNKLGLAAFLYDIGMVRLEDISLKSSSLLPQERDKIHSHPFYSSDILSGVKEISDVVITAIKQHHERMNGQGYPDGLRDTEISEYARIIGVVDVYEALTHERPNLKKISAHEAIKEMLYSGSASFDRKILKLLIDQIGIYPIGSWVELNTNEIGRVISINEDFSLRPLVKIFFDKDRERIDQPRLVDLVKQPNLFIKRPLSEDEVSRKTRIKGGE
jgi:HD-GYP domain-containing protein (c-di-GMP phosphodiesterase class II)